MFEHRLNDVVALLAGEREEGHPGERFVAHAQFFTWATVPHLPAIVEYMKFVAAARLYRLLERDLIDLDDDEAAGYKEHVANRYLEPGYVSRTVLSTSNVAFDAAGIDMLRYDSQSAADIVRFFVQGDQNSRLTSVAPTMNRAMRFVEADGFGTLGEPISSTKLKEVWGDVARAAPVLAADMFLMTGCTWDFPYSVKFVGPEDPATFRRLLGAAKFIQNRCCGLMHPDTLRKIRFPTWPDFIEETPVEFGPFTDSQSDAIKSYRVI